MTEGSTHNGRKALAYTPRTPWAMPKGTMPLRFAPQPRILPRPLPGSRPTPARLPPDFCSSPARREGRSVLTVPDLPPPGRPTPAEGVRRRRASWREFLMDALARRGRSHSGIAHAPVAGAPRPQRGSFGIVFLSSLFFSVFACHSLPLALRCVGPDRRGTACGTTSGGALEPGCRQAAHCHQRRFASPPSTPWTDGRKNHRRRTHVGPRPHHADGARSVS